MKQLPQPQSLTSPRVRPATLQHALHATVLTAILL
jgi:hypothetical protein